jgi:hypothetical protein
MHIGRTNQWIKYNLGNAVAVTQIDEDDPSMVPPTLDPTHQYNLATHVIEPKLAAVVRPAQIA